MAAPALTFFLFLLLVPVVLSSFLYEPARYKFEIFKSKYDKSYNSDEERDRHSIIFSERLQEIDRHNNDLNNRFKLGVNLFSDITHEEFKSKRLMKTPSPPRRSASRLNVTGNTKNILPKSFDWTDYGVVQKVKDQGGCGSCWAFASVSSIESAWAITNGKLYSLSEQQIVSCDKESIGCGGGLPEFVFEYAKNNNICTEELYPYDEHDSHCAMNTKKSDTPVRVSEYFYIMESVDGIKRTLIEFGPLTCLFHALDEFIDLGPDGIYDPDHCVVDGSINHVVLIVGYGSLTREDGSVFEYWKIKNSWSTYWADEGYAKVAMRYDYDGLCSMYIFVDFPVVEKFEDPGPPIEPPHTPTEPPHTPTEPPHTPTEPPHTPTEPPHTPTEPPHTPTEPPHTPTEPPHTPTEPPHRFTEPPDTSTSPFVPTPKNSSSANYLPSLSLIVIFIYIIISSFLNQ